MDEATVMEGVGQAAVLELDYARCAEITRRASSNFYYAFMLLPVERRRALHAVYAFCRFIDDIADDGMAKPELMLGRWRAELASVFEGTPSHAISRALADNVYRFNIPRRYLEEIIDGVEMDLTRKRYASFEELSLYCRRVASAVGLICIEIFGYRNPNTRIYAERLGLAFQLTNIIRDVREDGERGRIYLPLEDLHRFDVAEDEILRGVYSPRFRALMAFEAERARSYYQEAAAALAPDDRPTMIAAEGMRLIYGALLERIVRSNFQVFDKRHSLSASHKLYLVGRAWAGSRWRRIR